MQISQDAMVLILESLRQETPGCRNVVHLNNAGAALMAQPVLDTVIGHLTLESEIGGYEAARREQNRIEAFYDKAAKLIGAHRDEIAYLESATRAWQMVFYAVPFQPGDRILTVMAEYASNYLAYLQAAKRHGVEIQVIPNDAAGQLDLQALQAAVDDKSRGPVKLISLTHIPTNGGLVNPAEAVGRIARQNGILYLLDTCQSVGQMPIDVTELGCDFLTATGRKYLRGPRGTGFLYVRQSALAQLEPPMIDLESAHWQARDHYELLPTARRFEQWEKNIADLLGLSRAIQYAQDLGMPAIWNRIRILAQSLRHQLTKLPGVTVQDLGQQQCGIVSFTCANRDPVWIRDQLVHSGINVSVSTLDSTRLDMEARNLTQLVRASVHYYNTEPELSRFCQVLESLLS